VRACARVSFSLYIYICKNIITMHRPMNVKFCSMFRKLIA